MSRTRCFSFVLLPLLLTALARAETLTVPSDYATIQAAIDAAQDGDEIIVAPGTYDETIDFLGKAITVRSSDGADVTTIDATGLNDTVVTCDTDEGPDTILDGFTITGGNSSSVGGGMRISGSPTVSNCTFDGNTAGEVGGGMLTFSGSPTIINCTFSANTATNGGGMYIVSGSPTVTNCTFSGNTATSITGGGGGMYNIGSPTVINCTFDGNTALAGGGMRNGGNLTVTNCMFRANTASANGGGMRNAGIARVTNCTFVGNTAPSGGGMYNTSDLTVTNCTFSGNIATNGGGAINNSTSTDLTVSNCVFWGDSPNEISNTGDTLLIEFSCVQGGWTGEGNTEQDPLFVLSPEPGLDEEWGTEDDDFGDLRLLPGSPCIDAADNDAVPADLLDLDGDGDTAEPLPYDLDGVPRFDDRCATEDTGNGTAPIVDMGPYEFQDADCNSNGIDDSCDIAQGTSQDCSSNGVPDECDPDCNDNSIPDECEPDEDCNANGVQDICDIAGSTSVDCNVNSIPDECEEDICPGDVNDDCVIDPLDSGYILARFGCEYPGDGENCLAADANGDGNVDPLDVGFVLARFGQCP